MESIELLESSILLNQKTNLLVQLHRWAHRQDENFTTEAFAYLLEYLLYFKPSAGRKLIEVLTCTKKPAWLRGRQTIVVNSQPHTEEHGIPDLEISGDNFCIFIEVKVASSPEKTKLKGYQKELGRRREKHTKLVLLTKNDPSEKQVPPGVKQVLWETISKELRQLKMKIPGTDPGGYLIRQVLDFFKQQRLFPLENKSKLSRELMTYLKSAGESSIFNTRQRSLGNISKEPGLATFHSLLRLMREVAKGVEGGRWSVPVGVISSRMNREAWIGLSLGGLVNTFSVMLNAPEVVIFQRLSIKRGTLEIPTERHKKGHIGRIRRGSWENELDLNDRNFFGKPEEDQKQFLTSFFNQSLEYAEKTWGKVR